MKLTILSHTKELKYKDKMMETTKGYKMEKYNYAKLAKTEEYNECHFQVVETIKAHHNLSSEAVLSFSKNDFVYFLEKDMIKELWKDFTNDKTIEYGFEYTVFKDEYANDFSAFCISRRFYDVEEVRWLSTFIEFAFEIYKLEHSI